MKIKRFLSLLVGCTVLLVCALGASSYTNETKRSPTINTTYIRHFTGTATNLMNGAHVRCIKVFYPSAAITTVTVDHVIVFTNSFATNRVFTESTTGAVANISATFEEGEIYGYSQDRLLINCNRSTSGTVVIAEQP